MRENSIFIKALLSGGAAQVIGNVANIMFVPFAIPYLGATDYGVWIVILTIVNYLTLLQFGIGPAMAAFLAGSQVGSDQNKIISESLKWLTLIGTIFFTIVILFGIFVGKEFSQSITGLQDLNGVGYSALCIMTVLYFFRHPISIFPSAFIGLQAVHWERLYAAILPPLVSLTALLIVGFFNAGLVELAYFTGSGLLLCSAACGIHLFLKYPRVRFNPIRWLNFSKSPKSLLLSGWRFFVIALASSVVWGIDALIIGYYLDAKSITSYVVTFKLFIAAYTVFIIVNSALWPMFGQAVSSDDWSWVNSTYQKIIKLMPVLGGLIWIGGILFAKPIILLWAGHQGYAGWLVVFSLGWYGYVFAMINTNSAFLGGINQTKKMMWAGILEAIVKVILSIIFIQYFGLGGVAMGTALAATLTLFWILPSAIQKATKFKVIQSWRPVFIQFLILAPFLLVSSYVATLKFELSYILMSLLLIVLYLICCWLALDLRFILKVRSGAKGSG